MNHLPCMITYTLLRLKKKPNLPEERIGTPRIYKDSRITYKKVTQLFLFEGLFGIANDGKDRQLNTGVKSDWGK
jgi:hypothetical protein